MKVDVLQCAGAHQSVTGPVIVLRIELRQILPYNNALAVAEQLDIQVGLVSHTWALPRANTGISTFPPAATQVCTCHNSHHARSAGEQGNKGMTTPKLQRKALLTNTTHALLIKCGVSLQLSKSLVHGHVWNHVQLLHMWIWKHNDQTCLLKPFHKESCSGYFQW